MRSDKMKVEKLKGILYGQAILDGLGLTTEFYPYKVAQKKREELKRSYSDRLEFDFRIKSRNEGYLDWRKDVPQGCPTDDTDQAFLKYWALKDAGDDLSKAQQKFAESIVSWREHNLFYKFKRPARGLGGNTAKVIKRRGFTTDPVETSKLVWAEGVESKDESIPLHFRKSAANGALMSSSYILAYCDTLEKAQEDTEKLAEVTHYDPSVSAQCVAYITMLWNISRHDREMDKATYELYLQEAYDAGVTVLTKRVNNIAEDEALAKTEIGKHYRENKEQIIKDFSDQMHGAIFSHHLDETPYTKWEDLRLARDVPVPESNHAPFNNIGLSYRALRAGFFALREYRQKVEAGIDAQQAFRDVSQDQIFQGGDADTNGTVVGSLLGGYAGFGNIPESWRKDLRAHEQTMLSEIEKDASHLLLDSDIAKSIACEEIVELREDQLNPEVALREDQLNPEVALREDQLNPGAKLEKLKQYFGKGFIITPDQADSEKFYISDQRGWWVTCCCGGESMNNKLTS